MATNHDSVRALRAATKEALDHATAALERMNLSARSHREAALAIAYSDIDAQSMFDLASDARIREQAMINEAVALPRGSGARYAAECAASVESMAATSLAALGQSLREKRKAKAA